MNTRHALSLTISNIGLIVKVFLYTTVLILIGVAVFVSVTDPILEAMDEDIDLADEIREDFDLFFSGNREAGHSLNEGLKIFFSHNSAEITRAVVLYVVIFVLMRLGVSFALVPAAYVLYNKMSSNFNSGFLNAMIAMAGKGALFALTYTAITVPLDILIFIGTYFIASWLFNAINVIGLLIALLIALALYALRISLFGRWIPLTICENMKFADSCKAFFGDFKFSEVKEVYPSFLALLVSVCGIVASTAVFTVGVVPIAIVPAAFVGYNAITLVAYFNETKRKYYIDERIVSPFIRT